MAGGADCPDSLKGGEVVPVALDAGMLAAVDSYCDRFGFSGRSEAINELLMIGLSYASPNYGPPKS